MGNKLRDARKKAGMTQSELSEKSGVSRGTIIMLESGNEKNTSTKTLVSLAAALGMTVEQLFFSKCV